MTKANLQKHFNKSVRGLASQGFRRSFDPHNGCVYRGKRGRRCAIGWLIPDKNASRIKEGMGAICPGVLRLAGIRESEANKIIFSQLQTCHDVAVGSDMKDRPAAMKDNLRRFAERHGLKIPKVLQVKGQG